MTSDFTSAAHSSRCWGWRSVLGVSWFLPGGLPCHAVHWVQWGQGYLPLLCQQVQLLAHHCGAQPGVPLLTCAGDPEGRPGTLQSQPLPSLQQDLVVGGGEWREWCIKHLQRKKKKSTRTCDWHWAPLLHWLVLSGSNKQPRTARFIFFHRVHFRNKWLVKQKKVGEWKWGGEGPQCECSSLVYHWQWCYCSLYLFCVFSRWKASVRFVPRLPRRVPHPFWIALPR